MSRRFSLYLLVLVVVGAGCWAQEATSAATVTSPSGDRPPVVLGSEQQPANMLLGGFSVNAGYTDQSDTPQARFVFTPTIALQETRSRFKFTGSYEPGLTMDQRSLETSQFTQDLSGAVEWVPIRHMTVRARQNYVISTDPFQRASALIPSASPLAAPNESLALIDTKRTSIHSHGEVEYQFSARSTAGTNFTFANEDYRTPASALNSALVPSRTYNGTAFYARQWTGRQTSGLQFSAMNLAFSGNGNTRSYALVYFHTVKLNPNSSVTVYAGPEYEKSENVLEIPILFLTLFVPVHDRSIRPALGGTYQWNASRTSVTLDATHRISDGGGLMRGVSMTSFSAKLQRRVTRDWTLKGQLDFTDSNSVDLLTNESWSRSTAAGASVERQLGRNLMAGVSYNYTLQRGLIPGYPLGNYSQLSARIAYRFQQPLGR